MRLRTRATAPVSRPQDRSAPDGPGWVWKSTRAAWLLVAVWTWPVVASAENASSPRELASRLQQPISVTWQGQELGQALKRLAAAQQIFLWIDRRVNTQQLVDAELSDLPLQQAFEEIASRHQLGARQFGPLLYVGPQQSSLELAQLAQQVRTAVKRTSRRQQRHWFKAEPFGWPRLSQPRQLLQELLASAEVRLDESEAAIPHDLWRAQELPPMTMVDRAVLLLIGFDLTCQISQDGKSCAVVPIRRTTGKQGVLSLPWLEPTSRRRNPKPRRPQTGNRQVYSLKLKNQPLGRVLDQLAKQLKLEVEWDKQPLGASSAIRDKLVSCDLENVDLDVLLKSILEPAGLHCRREGQRITVMAGE